MRSQLVLWLAPRGLFHKLRAQEAPDAKKPQNGRFSPQKDRNFWVLVGFSGICTKYQKYGSIHLYQNRVTQASYFLMNICFIILLSKLLHNYVYKGQRGPHYFCIQMIMETKIAQCSHLFCKSQHGKWIFLSRHWPQIVSSKNHIITKGVISKDFFISGMSQGEVNDLCW